jgi:hypothetical protein
MIVIPNPYQIDDPSRPDSSFRPDPAVPKVRRGLRVRLAVSDVCFVVAGLSALVGMAAGMVMGILQDFTLAPAHAHLNLLGWVSMSLYGLYHRSTGRTKGWLAWLQVVAAALGAVGTGGGLGVYLYTGDHAWFPLVIAGSLAAFLGMILFMVILLSDLLRPNWPTSPQLA